jgi:D-alanyl-D-alanine carboxypeptidase (penicillin-binding protein 5/6)
VTRRRTVAAAASLALVVGGVVVPAAAAVHAAAAVPAAAVVRTAASPTPTPSTPTLPRPRATVLPELSVGGPLLASTGVVTDLPPGVPAPPQLRDVSWVLADADSGQVLAAKAPHARLRPASTLKVLTALVLVDRVAPSRVVTASSRAAGADGTRVGLVPGQPYTGRQLFQGLLMASGNDAAYALAEAGGGWEATLAAMNARAAQLGAHDTVAKDPSGLDAPGQVSSAYDLALIGRAALAVPDLRAYAVTKQVAFPGRVDPKTKKRGSYLVANHNRLLYNYPGTVGLKNGYTEAAHRTYISAVSRGGRTYLLTEMYGLDGSWRPQAAMYDWAFRYGGRARPVGTLVEPGTVTSPPTPTLTPTTAPTVGTTGPSGVATGAPGGRAAGAPAVGDAGPDLRWLWLAWPLALGGAVAGLRRRAVRRRRLRRRAH